MSDKEARVIARLAWNNWSDNENSRREIAAHETRDPVSAAAWDRVVAALSSREARPVDTDTALREIAMTEHEVIWLQPWCDKCANGGGRQWCEDNVWDQCDLCERRPVRYVIDQR